MMRQIKHLNGFLRGKTVETVDTKNANGIAIKFTDGTAVWIEAENIGNGFIGPIPYQIDPNVPLENQ